MINKEYNNGTQFSFIRSAGPALGETLQRINDISYGVIEAKPEVLDWKEIIPLYKKLCGVGGDIDEFCSNHVHGYAMVNGFSFDDTRKEAMYLHLRAELYTKRESGEIK